MGLREKPLSHWRGFSKCLRMVRLTADDLQAFVRDGYVVVRDAVPERFLTRADVEIDSLVATEPPMEGDGGAGQSSWFMPRHRLPDCENALRHSGALDIANELVAPHSLDFAFDHVQIAITVPPWSHVPGGPHIDGHGPGQDPPASFTMLAGIMLTDQEDGASGNLWVWPGSHVHHQQLFRERGTRVLCTAFGHATLLDPPAELGAAIPVTGRRGDLVLAHFLLGHNKGGNTAAHDRRTIYFRLSVPGHAARWEQTFLDPWTEYPELDTSH